MENIRNHTVASPLLPAVSEAVGERAESASLELAPGRICRVLICVVLSLALASVVGHLCKFSLGRSFGLLRFFDLNGEANVPTWYQSVTLLFCSLLLAATAFVRKRNGGRYLAHWKALSIIFFCMSLDEMVRIHEMLSTPLRSAWHSEGIFHYAWVVPGLLFVSIVVLSYLRFLADLPAKQRRLFIISGMVYLAGVLGMEMIGGRYASRHGVENMTYVLITTTEELCEMLGIVGFLYALLSYLKMHLRTDDLLAGFLADPTPATLGARTHAAP